MTSQEGPRPLRIIEHLLAFWSFLYDPQRSVAVNFLTSRDFEIPLIKRWMIISRHYVISRKIVSPHTTEEMLSFIGEILSIPDDRPGCIVEAGSYKGASSGKFSIAAWIVGRKLIICDSFQGLPPSDEDHGISIENRPVHFHAGEFAGSVDEVRSCISKYGVLSVCEFVEGWYSTSLVSWDQPIAAIYLDVDLASSTRACLTYLYPWLLEGGMVYSQDGHLPLVLGVFEDKDFWENVLKQPPPTVEGIWTNKLVSFRKVQPHNRQRV